MRFRTVRYVRTAAVKGVAVVTVGLAAGCSSSGGGGISLPVVGGLETTHLTVYDFPSIDSAGLYIAAQDGLFTKEGLTVTVIPDFKTTQDTVDMIESGKAQVSSGDYVTYMDNELGSNPNLEIVAEASVLQPNELGLMVKPRSRIATLKNLENKTVAVAGHDDIATLLIDSLLTENDVPLGLVHVVPGIPLPAVPTLVAKNQFATGPVPEPFVSIAEQQLGETVLADLDQGGMTNFPIQGYAVTKSWARQNPNTLKAFVTALDEGQEIADTNRAEVETVIEGQPLSVAKGVAAVVALPQFPDGIDPTRLQRVVNDMVQFGFFTGRELAAAKAFKVSSMVYGTNLANTDGTNKLISGT
jgi:NitT/TauT family transport system substrate-binding protein